MAVPYQHTVLPGGALQTTTIADRSVARHMAAYTFVRSARWVAAMMVLLAVITAALVIVTDDSPAQTAATSAAIVVLGLIVGCVLASPVWAFLWFVILRRTRRLLPEGTVLTSEFGDDWIAYRAGEIRSRFTLTDVDRIRLDRHRLVMFIARQPMIVIPRQLVPAEVAGGIVERHQALRARRPMASAATASDSTGMDTVTFTPTDGGGLEATMIADRGLATRVLRGAYTPASMVLIGILAVIFVVWAIVDNSRGTAPFISPPAIGGIFFAGVLIFNGLRMRARLRRLLPPGAQLRVRYLPDRVESTNGTIESSVGLVDITRVHETRSAVMLYQGRTPVFTIPAELVPPGFVDDLKQRIRR
ncbi:hypothetical protein [Gordonia bronchialis]|nr:hypothetical protein [Gordonia bronchialis]